MTPNEKKISCGWRGRASLRIEGFSHVKTGQYAGQPSAASFG
jgi:hypothetical protein